MVFTAIIYKTETGYHKTAVTCISENFSVAKKKLIDMYGNRLISIIYEVEKNLDYSEKNSVQSN